MPGTTGPECDVLGPSLGNDVLPCPLSGSKADPIPAWPGARIAATGAGTMIDRAVALSAAALLVALPAVAQEQDSTETQNMAKTLEAEVTTAEGESAGTVIFEQLEHGVVITARLENLPEGAHGFHIHETGTCEPPDFQSAGGHYNPQDQEHGLDTPEGYHAGDLPNIHVAADGTAMANVFAPQITLEEQRAQPQEPPFTLEDADGSAVMIHADADDYRSADSAGSRIACGVIALPRD